MDFKHHQAQVLARYAAMASHPGWRAYVLDRVKRMSSETPELYASLPQDLTAAMDAKQKASQQKPILSNSR